MGVFERGRERVVVWHYVSRVRVFKHACVLCVGVHEWVVLREREKDR